MIPITPVQAWTPDSLQILASTTAISHHLSVDHFVKTIAKESDGFSDINIQSRYPDSNGPNGKENSWGICQIDLDYHPEVSKEQAQDPVFCTEWMARQWLAGHSSSWSSYRLLASQDWPPISQ